MLASEPWQLLRIKPEIFNPPSLFHFQLFNQRTGNVLNVLNFFASFHNDPRLFRSVSPSLDILHWNLLQKVLVLRQCMVYDSIILEFFMSPLLPPSCPHNTTKTMWGWVFFFFGTLVHATVLRHWDWPLGGTMSLHNPPSDCWYVAISHNEEIFSKKRLRAVR